MILRQVILKAPDLQALADFYSWLPLTRGESLEVEIGRSKLVFEHNPDAVGGAHFAIDVPVAQFDEIAAWAEAKIGLVRSESGETRFRFESWLANACYFLDPAGNIGEFIAREERTHQDRFVGLSEIALVVSEVGEVVELLDTVGLSPYLGWSEDFAPIGDPDGLFIVVKEGRKWFPTNVIPAEAVPVEVVFETETSVSRRLKLPSRWPLELS